MTESSAWSGEFTNRAERRAAEADPDWGGGSRLHPAVVRSVQKFQVGESGDGAHLIGAAAAAGDADYERAIRLFVAEEQNHARMLAEVLRAAGASTTNAHWSDVIFVRLRRLLGLRLELMVLTIAEVVALRYYRALADGGDDRLLTDVSERILADERFHVPFQCRRLRLGFAHTPGLAQVLIKHGWRAMAFGVIIVVAADHGPALRVCGVSRRAFIRDSMRLFDDAAAAVFDGNPSTAHTYSADLR
ncbi:ferritin-like domain-containing protein [Gordonia sp. CPCC 205515]|uniref:ferritin-like domain-containing protein n=1 Tax=Gordonia sp. CPCC 205515 TaxID=3140791 RepID=UPI003AF3FE89